MSSAAEQIHTINQMETPKSGVGVFELPCGHLNEETQELVTQVELKEITGHEEDMLASKQVHPAMKMSLLLAGCVVRIGDVTDARTLRQMLQGLPVGDRVFLIFAARRVTLGNELPVRETCPACDVKHLYMIDLANDLDVRKMRDPMKRVHDIVLPSGKMSRVRVSTGADEERMGKMMRKTQRADALSQSILMRMELLEGEKPTLQMVKSLSMSDRNFLRDEFQEIEGGVDTKLELDCPSCGNEWEKDLDLSAASFFFPGGQRKH